MLVLFESVKSSCFKKGNVMMSVQMWSFIWIPSLCVVFTAKVFLMKILYAVTPMCSLWFFLLNICRAGACQNQKRAQLACAVCGPCAIKGHQQKYGSAVTPVERQAPVLTAFKLFTSHATGDGWVLQHHGAECSTLTHALWMKMEQHKEVAAKGRGF